MWKVSCFYEKVHNLANFGVYATILSGWGRHIEVTKCLPSQAVSREHGYKVFLGDDCLQTVAYLNLVYMCVPVSLDLNVHSLVIHTGSQGKYLSTLCGLTLLWVDV